ncbi:unnamed protein product [Notodromas monacha]|uniref:General transcription factor IIH subunit 3 n=1 Tax=Notodromas monacha TaxID=399045 RepID=A0A7R9BLS2_9CRUS|nr:unnamed protein product [Notodromas monacha]CAG0916512.1 unnamed protein product [Notodromas monacha]
MVLKTKKCQDVPMSEESANANVTEVNLLCVVLDLGAENWRAAVNNDVDLLNQCIDSVLAFANAYLAIKTSNRIAFLGCDPQLCRFLYPLATEKRITVLSDGQFPFLAELDAVIKQEMKSILALQDPNNVEAVLNDPLIPAALCKAMCYVNRTLNSLKNGEKFSGRILIVTPTANFSSGHMTLMNTFFAAQKLTVVIDACLVGCENSGLLRQACDITGGIYNQMSPHALLQSLLFRFLPSLKDRAMLNRPVQPAVDHRASCICHKTLVEIGFVCSVCLSVFCKFSPICSTCHSVFKLAPLAGLPSKPNKKRKIATNHILRARKLDAKFLSEFRPRGSFEKKSLPELRETLATTSNESPSEEEPPGKIIQYLQKELIPKFKGRKRGIRRRSSSKAVPHSSCTDEEVSPESSHEKWRKEISALNPPDRELKSRLKLADGVLCETRRKSKEMRSVQSVIDKLRVLRSIREEARKESSTLRDNPLDKDRFLAMHSQVSNLVERQLQIYAKEEKTLKIFVIMVQNLLSRVSLLNKTSVAKFHVSGISPSLNHEGTKEIPWWFPGHMNKGLQQMQKVLKNVDCFIEVHDARIPFTGRCSLLRDRLTAIKPLILLLNKCDLVPPELLPKMRRKLIADGATDVFWAGQESSHHDTRMLVRNVKRILREVPRYHRSESVESNVMIVGVPNVGKSTVINRLRRLGVGGVSKGAPVGAIAGMTRSLSKIKVSLDPLIYVFDTPGILEPRVRDQESAMKLALVAALPDDRIGPLEILSYMVSWMKASGEFDVDKLPEYLGHEQPCPSEFESYKGHLGTSAERLCCDHAVSRDWTRKFRSPATGEMVVIPDLTRAAAEIISGFRSAKFGKFCLDVKQLEEKEEAVEMLDAVEERIKVSYQSNQNYEDENLPVLDPVIRSFCKNCNLVLSEPELMLFVENFYNSVNRVRTTRDRLAFQAECDSCNVILASGEDVPRVVEILAAKKNKS